jgi:hypothetical protein
MRYVGIGCVYLVLSPILGRLPAKKGEPVEEEPGGLIQFQAGRSQPMSQLRRGGVATRRFQKMRSDSSTKMKVSYSNTEEQGGSPQTIAKTDVGLPSLELDFD